MLEFKRRSSISCCSLSLLYDDIPRGWRLGIYYSLKGCTLQFFGPYFPGKIFVSVRCVYMLTFHCSIRVSILVYAGVGSGYSVRMLFRCMVSNVLVFPSVIVTLNSAVLLVAWMDCCVCPVLQLERMTKRCFLNLGFVGPCIFTHSN